MLWISAASEEGLAPAQCSQGQVQAARGRLAGGWSHPCIPARAERPELTPGTSAPGRGWEHSPCTMDAQPRYTHECTAPAPSTVSITPHGVPRNPVPSRSTPRAAGAKPGALCAPHHLHSAPELRSRDKPSLLVAQLQRDLAAGPRCPSREAPSLPVPKAPPWPEARAVMKPFMNGASGACSSHAPLPGWDEVLEHREWDVEGVKPHLTLPMGDARDLRAKGAGFGVWGWNFGWVWVFLSVPQMESFPAHTQGGKSQEQEERKVARRGGHGGHSIISKSSELGSC